MLVMLLASLVAGYFILIGANWASLGWQSISTLLLSANLLVWDLTRGYWGHAGETLPLLHNWSLSLEEQFYLFYPFFMLAGLRWFPKKLLPCLAGIFIVSLALCIIGTLRYPAATFYMLPTRAWELAGGCLLGVFAQRKENKLAPARECCERSAFLYGCLALLGVALIAASWFLVDERSFPGYEALMPVAGCMLVVQFAGGTPARPLCCLPRGRFVSSARSRTPFICGIGR